MAIAATVLASSITTTDATSYNTASISPAANSLLLVFAASSISAGTAPTITVSGLGLTWTTQIDYGYDPASPVRRIAAFTAQCGASPGSGALTLDMGGVTSTHASWVVIQITGADPSGFPVWQSVSGGASSGTAGSLTLGAPINTESRAFSFWGQRQAGTALPAANWTELFDGNISSPSMLQEAQWRSDAFDTAPAATFSASARWAGIALEVAAAPSGGQTVNAVVATATAQAIAPTVSTAMDATVSAVVATATATAQAPTVAADALVVAVVATATATAFAPVVAGGAGSADGNADAVVATATATALAPSVFADALVLAVAATATARAGTPVVVAIEPTFIFEPPTYSVQVQNPPLVKRPRQSITRSMSVVRINGTLRTFKTPSNDMLIAAGEEGTDYFLGGRTYTVPLSVATELQNAGYTVT